MSKETSLNFEFKNFFISQIRPVSMGNKIYIQKTLSNIPDEINKSQIIENENKKFKDISQYNTINSSTFFNPIGFKKIMNI